MLRPRRCIYPSLVSTSRKCLHTIKIYPGAKCQSSAAVVSDGPPLTETNRAESSMKRFWNDVGLDKRGDMLAVTLDNRPLKTPSGNTLLLPAKKALAATLVAAEWDNQEMLIKPHALPMTSLTSRAMDALMDEATCVQVRATLLDYLDTDAICFHQDYPPQLVTLQTEHWDPLLSWARKTFDVEIHTFDSILFNSQPKKTKQKFKDVLSQFDHWELAAMERSTYTTKSFIIALALVLKHLTVEQAALAAAVEVSSQIQRWGEVEDSHDVDFYAIRQQLGSAACLLSNI